MLSLRTKDLNPTLLLIADAFALPASAGISLLYNSRTSSDEILLRDLKITVADNLSLLFPMQNTISEVFELIILLIAVATFCECGILLLVKYKAFSVLVCSNALAILMLNKNT